MPLYFTLKRTATKLISFYRFSKLFLCVIYTLLPTVEVLNRNVKKRRKNRSAINKCKLILTKIEKESLLVFYFTLNKHLLSTDLFQCKILHFFAHIRLYKILEIWKILNLYRRLVFEYWNLYHRKRVFVSIFWLIKYCLFSFRC